LSSSYSSAIRSIAIDCCFFTCLNIALHDLPLSGPKYLLYNTIGS
jgi:hypothetical protein